MDASHRQFLDKIEQHKGIIFKISKMYMDNADDQQDLYQEITYQAWKSFVNFKGESQFSTWLYRVALNTAIIFLKSEKKRSFINNADVSDYKLEHQDYDTEKEVQLEKMYEAIQQLGAIDKAFIFYYLENFSGRDIAKQMDISEANVRVKMNRAKNKLKDILSKTR